ncbi:MAG: leucine-rich repeat domain-containing protein [Clostridia bacterium]|nr:leucine-rich repeat domain-containing protein [Clostridia bacterium]
MKKRLLIYTLAFGILIALLLPSAGEECHDKETAYSTSVDGWRIEYTLSENGEATIISADWLSNSQVYVPEALDGHKVVAIGDYAFQQYDGSPYYSNAEWVYIPASVTYIGANPFSNWCRLKEIVVDPDNPRFNVVDSALYDNTEQRLIACPLTVDGSFTVREGTKIIGELAFGSDEMWGGYHSALSEIILPNSVEEIRKGAFEQSLITSIKLPASLREIGEAAFYCSSLTEISFNDSLTRVGKYAFGKTDLREVTLPDSIEHISYTAFANCYDLKVVNASQRIKEMLTIPPEDCYEWRVLEDGSAMITDVVMLPDEFVVTIPDTLDGHPVTALGDFAFRYADNVNWYDSVTTVVIPAGINSIGLNPFSGCEHAITEILVDPANECYESVGGILYDKQRKALISYPIAAASYQRGEQYITVKADTLTIDGYAFCQGAYSFGPVSNESKLYITLPEGLRKIDYGAFSNLEIGSINIPSTMEEIGERAFYHASIDNITIANGVKTIGREAFANTFIDSQIEIPSSVETIAERAFFSSWLNGIKFNEGLKYIGSLAFANCWTVDKADLPESIEYVAFDAFE